MIDPDDFEEDDDIGLLREGKNKDKPQEKSKATTPEDDAFAREKIREVLEIGTKALKGAADLAEASDDVRAFRAVAGLVQSISAAASQLLADKSPRNNQNQPALPAPEGQTAAQITGDKKIAFVGSPGDMIDFLEQSAAKKEVVEVNPFEHRN